MGLDAFLEDPNIPLEEKMNKLHKDIQKCSSCPLSKLSINPEGTRLSGHGDPSTKILFIAQNPSFRKGKYKAPKIFGIWENRNDRIFIENLAKVGIPRKKVFVTNIVKCSTLDNEVPSRGIVTACQRFLMREIGCIRPRVIVTIGSIAKNAFKAKTGTWTKWSGIDIFAIWHPSYLLRQGVEAHIEEYLHQMYITQFRNFSNHPAFEGIKIEPFEVTKYP